MTDTCRSCQTAAHIIRRLNFQDNISWGPFGGPSSTLHATHSNTGIGKNREPLCRFYSNEIAWLSAGRPTRTTVYMAHPVSGPKFHDNIRNATIWLRYLRRLPISSLNELVGVEFQMRPLILCPWLAAIEEDEMYPGGREGVIADARDTVMMFDEVWLTGGVITDGMGVEARTARVLRDLTHLGPLPGDNTGPRINGHKR